MATPFKHQLVSIKHNRQTPLVFDCSDPGTGKTLVRILSFAERRRQGGGCLLVVAPKSLLKSVWAADVARFAPDLSTSVAYAENREAAFERKADIYIINHDGVKWLAKQKPAFFKRFTELAVDESTAFKHHTSQRSKALASVARHFTHIAMMTGTPSGNSITDVWHQMFILDRGKRLGDSFYRFRDAVCIPRQIGRQAQMVKWEDKPGAEEAVFGLLKDVVIRHKFEDCVDIPPNFQYAVSYELSPAQMRAYKQMQDTQILLLKNSTKAVLAVNAASAATKLLQIASGATYDGSGDYQLVDAGRYEMIMDLVEARKHSLVFFFWKHQRDNLVFEAHKRGLTYCVMDGETPQAIREQQVKDYQAGKYQVMIAHPKSAAHGLTLTKGTTTIWSSPTYDLEIFKQGSKRQHRMGQTERTETIVILGAGTLDEKAYAVMSGKGERMTNLLGLFEGALD